MATTVIDLSRLNGNDGFRLDGAAQYDYSGRSVSNAGDVNGDGFDDVIIGASGADPNGKGSGSSYIVFGKSSGFEASMNLSRLDGSNGFRLDGVSENNSFGRSVSSAGDVNGDGCDDLIIGAVGVISDGRASGSSYVVFGKKSVFDATIDLSSLDGKNGFRLDGKENDFSGFSVSNAGDVNGDGFDDVMIGAWNAEGNDNQAYARDPSGVSYIVFGKASGFDAMINLPGLDGHNGFRLKGLPGEYSGFSVSDAGDVNGDGYGDVIVGAIGNSIHGRFTGSSYIVFGRSSNYEATLNLSSLNGNNGSRLYGEVEYDYSGIAVSGAGDMNGDGFDDVIIGASGADPNGEGSGSSYVVFGKSSGFDASQNLSSLDGTNGFRLEGTAAGDRAGTSVSRAGDVNGDGFDDVIVGAPGANVNAQFSGSSYVLFGKASGFDASLNLWDLDGSNGFQLTDLSGKNGSGGSVSGAGDVNNDGFDDLLVSAPNANPNGIFSGSSYIVFGRSGFTGGNVIAGTPEDDVLRGSPDADIFEAGDGNDLMIGRGGADEFHGDAGNDKINVADLNFALVDGGTGLDVLHTDGKDLSLDLTDYLDKIQGIETICLYGRGDNTLTLTGAELQALSDTTNTLKVHGNAGDRVILEGEWIDEGNHGFYHTYTQDDAVLLVGMNMTAVFA